MSNNRNLNRAREAKNDEYYTVYEEAKKELDRFADQFAGKKVLCNCRDIGSAFEKYFERCDCIPSFVCVGLKEWKVYERGDDGKWKEPVLYSYPEGQIASFDDEIGLRLLNDCDIVITNPPFSLMRKFVQLVMEAKKDMLIIAPLSTLCMKKPAEYYLHGLLKSTGKRVSCFVDGNGEVAKLGNTTWITTLRVEQGENLKLTKSLSEIDAKFIDEFPQVLFIDKLANIPYDYDGLMAVPQTFQLANDSRFEIVDARTIGGVHPLRLASDFCVNGQKKKIHKDYHKKDPLIRISPHVNGKKYYLRFFAQKKLSERSASYK